MIAVAGNPTLDVIVADRTYRRYGGPIYYAGKALAALGARPLLVGVVDGEHEAEVRRLLEGLGAEVRLIRGDAIATFQLDYTVRPRRVRMLARPAARIGLVEGDVVVLSPVFDELAGAEVRAEWVAVDLQGYVRSGLEPPRAHMAHFSDDDLPLSPEGARRLASRWPLAVYTLGADGAYLFQGGGAYYVESARVQAADSTGSGDVFLASFVYLHAVKGLDPLEALCRASMYVAGFLASGVVRPLEYRCEPRRAPL